MERQLRSVILEVSQELSGEDLRGVSFLATGLSSSKLPGGSCCCSSRGGRSCCGGHHGGAAEGLSLLELLYEKGIYSRQDMSTLVSILQEVGRQDLASKCQGLSTPAQASPSDATQALVVGAMSPSLPVLASSLPTDLNTEDTLPPCTPNSPSASLNMQSLSLGMAGSLATEQHTLTASSFNTSPSLLTTESTLPGSLNTSLSLLTTESTLPGSTLPGSLNPSLSLPASKSILPASKSILPANRRVSSPLAPSTHSQVVPCPSPTVPPANRSVSSSSASPAHSQVVPCRRHGNTFSQMALKRYEGSALAQSCDSFYMVGHKDLEDYPGPTHQDSTQKTQKAAPESNQSPTKLDRSWTTPDIILRRGITSLSASLSSLTSSTASPCHHHYSPRPVYVWDLKRLDLVSPIFNHSGKAIDRKFQVKAGGKSRKGGCTLTFLLKLYPNGVNWDQDVSASLQVKVLSSLGQSSTSSTLYFGVTVLEDNKKQVLLAERRRVCKLQQQQQEFLLNEFLAHDVLKGSQAKSLKLSFHVELSYELGTDWVCIGTDLSSYQ